MTEPVAWRYPMYWWQPMQHTEWMLITHPKRMAANAAAAGVKPEPLYATPPDAREAMRLALGHIMRGEEQPNWNAYAACVDQARDVLRAAMGESAE